MKKDAKNTVFFRMELTNFSVVIRFSTEQETSVNNCLYTVVFYNGFKNKSSLYFFRYYEEAQSFVFENFAWMIIPSEQVLHEGTHLFVY